MDAFSFAWALNFILFCLGLNAITYIFRTIVEYFLKDKENMLWNKLVLPLFPLLMGGIIAYFAKGYQYFDGNIGDTARIFFGLTAGTFSGLAYQIVNGVFKEKIQQFKEKQNLNNQQNIQSQEQNLNDKNIG